MITDIKFDFDDISLIPAIISNIKSRNEINIFDENNKLPIFVSPMDTVIDDSNYKLFSEMGFYTCIPRKCSLENKREYEDECFISYGLDEIEKMILAKKKLPQKILIDVANAHSIRVFECAKRIKNEYINELMIGNIANPNTYKIYGEIGVEYIRCGIGAGHACTTSANASIHYPMASLISECFQIKKDGKYKTKIIADGGFKNFGDIIKAIGIGANSVMLGNIINKSIESCSQDYIKDNGSYIKIDKRDAIDYFNEGEDVFKLFRGMSTKEVQKKWGKKELRTSEGITKLNKVEYSIKTWVDNFKDYLKSCMSYQSKKNICDFIGNSEYVHITQNAYNRFNK
jgi:IMP dehydrogenase